MVVDLSKTSTRSHPEKMIVNLDKISAQFSQRILRMIGYEVNEKERVDAENLEKVCAQALGVLQEQGVFGSVVYLLSKSGDETGASKLSAEEFVACGVMANLIDELGTNELKGIGCAYDKGLSGDYTCVNDQKRDLLKHVSDVISEDLKKLLFVKSLYEQTLIYALYGAKASSV